MGKLQRLADYFRINKSDLIEDHSLKPATMSQAPASPLEQELLDNFHRLNNEGQNDLVKYSKLLVTSGDYEKDVALSS